MEIGRPSREFTFLLIARAISQRGTCQRAKVGALIVKENRIISTGYNGSPPHMDHCYNIGCEIEDEGCERTIHAEANAIAWAARAGVSTRDATMYCTHAPCYACAKLMLSAGIIECHYDQGYRDTRGIELLDKALVKVVPY